VKSVAELSASNRDYDLRKLLQNVLDAMQMSQVKWLIPSDQKPSMLFGFQWNLTPLFEF